MENDPKDNIKEHTVANEDEIDIHIILETPLVVIGELYFDV